MLNYNYGPICSSLSWGDYAKFDWDIFDMGYVRLIGDSRVIQYWIDRFTITTENQIPVTFKSISNTRPISGLF